MVDAAVLVKQSMPVPITESVCVTWQQSLAGEVEVYNLSNKEQILPSEVSTFVCLFLFSSACAAAFATCAVFASTEKFICWIKLGYSIKEYRKLLIIMMIIKYTTSGLHTFGQKILNCYSVYFDLLSICIANCVLNNVCSNIKSTNGHQRTS